MSEPAGGDDLAPTIPDGHEGPAPQAFDPALGGVHHLLADMRVADQRSARARALIRLGRAGDAKARPQLEAAAADPDWVTRKYAVSALGALGDPASLPVAWRALADPHVEVRRAAARMLGGAGLSIDELLRLAGDDDWQIRAVALEHLAGCPAQAALTALVDAVRDPVWLNRWLAIAGLRELPFGVPAMLGALDDDPALAAHAATTLAGFAAGGGPHACGEWTDDQAAALRAELLGRLPGASPWKRLALAQAFGRLDHEAARDALTGLIGHPDAEIEDAILAHGPSMAARLRAALAAPDWIRRWHACRLLGRLGDPASGVALLPLLRDPRGEVRLAALEGVRRLAPAEGLPDLRAALADASWHTRLAAVEAIAARADDAGLPDVVAALADPRAEVRQTARRELMRLGLARPAAVRATLDAARGVPSDEVDWLRGRLTP